MNITDSIKHFAQSTPEALALLYSDETITYVQLERKVEQGVQFFTQAGVKPSQVIALMLEDELLTALSMLALARMGCTVITLESSMSSVMLEEVTTQAEVDAFVISTSSKQAFTLPIYRIDASSFEGDVKIDVHLYIESPQAPWLYILGSGTTGKPKIIPITHEQMLSRVNLDGQALEINSDDIVANCMSLHFFVPKLRLFDALVCGGTYVLLHRKEKALMGMVQKFEITVLYGAVLHVENFLKSRIDNKQELLKSLKVLAVSSSTVSEDLRQRIQTQLTPNLYVMYGCNEVSPVSVLSAKEEASRALSIGQVVPGVEVEVFDPQGQTVPFGEVGQLRVKSPALIDAYVNDEAATNKNFKEGWFYPGDLVSLHEDGELCYHGRADHMMIMNGINIYPSHIESVKSSSCHQ
jgi:acyl-coenzyme A synthetase/AMP-(fatty) acid ligase